MALRVAGLQPCEVFRPVAELRVGLGDDLVGSAEAVKIIHVKRTEIDLHRLEKALKWDALLFGFHAVNVRVELWHIHGERRKDARQAGRLIAFADDVLKRLEQCVVTQVGAVLDVKLESADGAQPHDGRWRHREHKRVLDRGKLTIQRPGDSRPAQARRPALLEGFETEKDDAGIGSDTEPAYAQAGKCHRVLHTGLFEADLRHAPDYRLGAVERRRVGQLGESDEVLLVLGRHKPGRDLVETPTGEKNESAIDQQRNAALANHSAHAGGILVARPPKHPVERPKEPAEKKVNDALKRVAVVVRRPRAR